MVFFCHSDDLESCKQNKWIIINGINTLKQIQCMILGTLNWKNRTPGNKAVTTMDKKIANIKLNPQDTVPLRNKRTKTYAKYANAHTCIRICSCAYTRMAICVYTYTKYTRMLISIYELAYCCFLCNTVVKCCFNGPVILRLYGLTKWLRAKYGRTSHSFTIFFYIECVL